MNKENDYDEYYTSTSFDEDGGEVICPICRNADIVCENGEYKCPDCGYKLSRSEYMNYIGADYYKPECINCKGNYPSCREDCDLFQ